MDIGIDKIGFYVPKDYIDIVELAKRRDVDPNKFTIGIGQDKQAVPLPHQDAVTMAASSADSILTDDDKKNLGMMIVGTESSVDESKSTAAFLMDLLDLPEDIRAYEIKQACYGATAGLQTAYDFVSLNPDKKVLVIATDIARYGIKTPGEVTQGAGSVAMLISQNPRVLKLNHESVYMTKNVGDFWRPTFSKTAFARGKFSNEIYVNFFETLWTKFQNKYSVTADDFSTMLFHIPYTKMGTKALRTLEGKVSDEKYAELTDHYQNSIKFSRDVGNLYTGSLYLGLLSYLVNGAQADENVLMFSYGSGAVGELFSAKIQPDFEQVINKQALVDMLNNRQKISIDEYEKIYQIEYKNDTIVDPTTISDKFYLSEIKENERIYKKLK
ncbi:hydroxymethylglutaryl-CoA synthase [Companilactobacillus pabuli]|uniref:Hydroxymethylglutaryl-CoA synthase n=1 Tax=Companilactobacillus pabuli TaxID=2714036 RepID=A0A7L7KVG4_9LACO|nr:hydroxymethylglutaryl-CoA synthase [Companilactobacillus pabuli]AKP03358.1 hydroxymethylglutaryl-CoA synthase [Companilactobacillus farciminis]AKS51658.1 hydroxymethylglutaryl-CoA synthase [Companilactobacillus farciminis]QMT83439.1 hydroxymethylglutaryl-CoA synthase [Companilactobacillus pabuli]